MRLGCQVKGSARPTDLWLCFGSRAKYFHDTDQNYIITKPKEKPAQNQVPWLVTSGSCEVFGVRVQISCYAYREDKRAFQWKFW